MLSSEFDRLRNALAGFPFVRLHPDTFLHIPIQELGFVTETPEQRDELTPARLQEFIAIAQHPVVDFPRFEISLGGANSFIDAAFLDVHDGGWLSRIHRRLLDFVVIPPDSRFPFLPHATIAHYTKSAPVGNLPAVLADWRDQTFGSFKATHVEIVLLDTSTAYPELETVHAFELGARSRSVLTVAGP
jgi:2'-5' RNA ligase